MNLQAGEESNVKPGLSADHRSSNPRVFAFLVGISVAGFVLATPALLPTLEGVLKEHPDAPALPLLWLSQLINICIYTTLAALLGLYMAPRVGLDAPLLRALARRESVGLAQLKPLFKRAIVWGLLAAGFAMAILALFSPHLPAPLAARTVEDLAFGERLLAAARGASSAFYGGIVEEIMMRWGLLSALAWLAIKCRMKRQTALISANALTALAFGAGHLPALYAAIGAESVTNTVILYILLANGVGALIFGAIYIRRGLEVAMGAHAVADIGLHALPVFF
jgi:hypothetical protein